eukprot:CAMPEP_0174850198 /NCGR_PEP_ID=MMETSP1114-20130205/19092_1 /TAXON_ID=312471 /ORGANISM="Neobodo designis, Strain CCAP 1951/1" /LENGTH=374 /DNA_ID=CAMNT_0016084635 /DNA_START=48 /DNA_END=1172 /DNA_ORIENTATION=-
MRAVKVLALAVLIAAVAAKPPTGAELAGYTFDQFVADFGRGYAKGSAEYNDRRKIFEDKKAEAIAHNAQGHSWTKGINEFADYTDDEFKARLGGKIHEQWGLRSELKSSQLHSTFKATGAAVPETVDWRNYAPSVLTGVKDQGQCGSCWAHASVENLETHWAIRTGQLFTLSQQQITACAPNPNQCGGVGGCGGSIAELAYDYIAKAGIAEEWTYPYTAYEGVTGTCKSSIKQTVVNVTGYTSVTSNDQAAVMEALATRGPLAINVAAMPWQSYTGGIFTGCDYSKNITIDHVVQLVGYGHDWSVNMDYWIVRNSWSPAWGENGYIRVARHKTPECGWDVNPQDGTACKGSPDQLWVCGVCGLLFDTVFPNVHA